MINQVRLISIEQEYEVELDRLKKLNSFLVVDLHPSSRKITFLFPRKDSFRVDAFHRAHWKSFFFHFSVEHDYNSKMHSQTSAQLLLGHSNELETL